MFYDDRPMKRMAADSIWLLNSGEVGCHHCPEVKWHRWEHACFVLKLRVITKKLENRLYHEERHYSRHHVAERFQRLQRCERPSRVNRVTNPPTVLDQGYPRWRDAHGVCQTRQREYPEFTPVEINTQ